MIVDVQFFLRGKGEINTPYIIMTGSYFELRYMKNTGQI